jgi:hypothetical protein
MKTVLIWLAIIVLIFVVGLNLPVTTMLSNDWTETGRAYLASVPSSVNDVEYKLLSRTKGLLCFKSTDDCHLQHRYDPNGNLAKDIREKVPPPKNVVVLFASQFPKESNNLVEVENGNAEHIPPLKSCLVGESWLLHNERSHTYFLYVDCDPPSGQRH